MLWAKPGSAEGMKLEKRWCLLWCRVGFRAALRFPVSRLSSGHSSLASPLVGFSSVTSDSLQPHGLQPSRLSCPSATPGAYPNSCLLGQWCHPTTSSSVIPFSLPPSGSFQVSQFFASGGQSISFSFSICQAFSGISSPSLLLWCPLATRWCQRTPLRQLPGVGGNSKRFWGHQWGMSSALTIFTFALFPFRGNLILCWIASPYTKLTYLLKCNWFHSCWIDSLDSGLPDPGSYAKAGK